MVGFAVVRGYVRARRYHRAFNVRARRGVAVCTLWNSGRREEMPSMCRTGCEPAFSSGFEALHPRRCERTQVLAGARSSGRGQQTDVRRLRPGGSGCLVLLATNSPWPCPSHRPLATTPLHGPPPILSTAAAGWFSAPAPRSSTPASRIETGRATHNC